MAFLGGNVGGERLRLRFCGHPRRMFSECQAFVEADERRGAPQRIHSTVTDFAKFRGWSTSHPRLTAM
jgi:hypothetical protein